MAYLSSASDAESFHKHVGVVCVIWYRGLLNSLGSPARAIVVSSPGGVP
jgi:hypothetical protein